MLSINPAETRDTANFNSLNNYTSPSFTKRSLDAKLSEGKDQFNSVRYIEESENNILDGGPGLIRDKKSLTKTIKNVEQPTETPQNNQIYDQNDFNKTKAMSPKSFKMNMYLEKIETQDSQAEDTNEKIRNALLKKYDVSLGNIPEETKIFSTIQESKQNNSNTKYSLVLSNEKQSPIKDSTEKNYKTVNFADSNAKSDRNNLSDYKNYYSTNYASKTIDLKNSSYHKNSYGEDRMDSNSGRKTANDNSNHKSKFSNNETQNDLDPKINFSNKLFLLENKEKLANSIYNYQDITATKNYAQNLLKLRKVNGTKQNSLSQKIWAKTEHTCNLSKLSVTSDMFNSNYNSTQFDSRNKSIDVGIDRNSTTSPKPKSPHYKQGNCDHIIKKIYNNMENINQTIDSLEILKSNQTSSKKENFDLSSASKNNKENSFSKDSNLYKNIKSKLAEKDEFKGNLEDYYQTKLKSNTSASVASDYNTFKKNDKNSKAVLQEYNRDQYFNETQLIKSNLQYKANSIESDSNQKKYSSNVIPNTKLSKTLDGSFRDSSSDNKDFQKMYQTTGISKAISNNTNLKNNIIQNCTKLTEEQKYMNVWAKPSKDFSMHLSNFMMKQFHQNPHNVSMREFRIKLTESLKTDSEIYSKITQSPKVELNLLDGSKIETNQLCLEKKVQELLSFYLTDKFDSKEALKNFYQICNILSEESALNQKLNMEINCKSEKSSEAYNYAASKSTDKVSLLTKNSSLYKQHDRTYSKNYINETLRYDRSEFNIGKDSSGQLNFNSQPLSQKGMKYSDSSKRSSLYMDRKYAMLRRKDM